MMNIAVSQRTLEQTGLVLLGPQLMMIEGSQEPLLPYLTVTRCIIRACATPDIRALDSRTAVAARDVVHPSVLHRL